jgi:replicative superfamily II helicase
MERQRRQYRQSRRHRDDPYNRNNERHANRRQDRDDFNSIFKGFVTDKDTFISHRRKGVRNAPLPHYRYQNIPYIEGNILYVSPTGSGKSAMMLHLLFNLLKTIGVLPLDRQVIFIAPNQQLCEKMLQRMNVLHSRIMVTMVSMGGTIPMI